MYSKRISDDLKQEFSTSRGIDVTFIDPDKTSKKSKSKDLEIVLTNYDAYMDITGAEFIPYKNLMINPLSKIRRDISYEKVNPQSCPNHLNIATMLYDDPVRIWKGFSHGDIIKITRPNKKVYYRRVA